MTEKQSIASNIIETTCKATFKKQCTLDWSDLDPLTKTSRYPDQTPQDKWCNTCNKKVHFVTTDTELAAYSKQGDCVAVLWQEMMLLGEMMPMPDYEYPTADDLPPG